MKYLAILSMTFLFSCTKESTEPPPAAEEDVQVMVFATRPGDTTIIASTPIQRLRVQP